GLAQEALGRRTGQGDLQGDESFEGAVPCLVDDSHAAAADLFEEIVARGECAEGILGQSGPALRDRVRNGRFHVLTVSAPSLRCQGRQPMAERRSRRQSSYPGISGEAW